NRCLRRKWSIMAVENTDRPSQDGIYMLVGGAGVPNYGDELIVEKWTEWLTRRADLSDVKFVIELNHHKVARMYNYGATPRVYPSGDLAFAKFIFGGGNFAEMFDRGCEFARKGTSDKRLQRLQDRIRRTRVYHLHGGGYLNDYWPAHAFSLGVGNGLKLCGDARVIGTGLGLGPFKDEGSKARVVDAAAAFDAFEVRDTSSFETASSHGISGLDDIFLSAVNGSVTTESALHVSLSDRWNGFDFGNVFSKEFVNSFQRVYFWICTPRDAKIFASIADMFRHVEPLVSRDLIKDIPCGRRNFMVTERFHPHLVGARLGFEGVYYSANPYYDAKHGSVTGLGSSFASWDGSSSLDSSLLSSRPSLAMVSTDS